MLSEIFLTDFHNYFTDDKEKALREKKVFLEIQKGVNTGQVVVELLKCI